MSKREIFEEIELEKKYSYLKKFTSVNTIIGAKPSNKFKKIKHLRPMLSLSNAFEKKDMEDFFKKINNYLNNKSYNVELFSILRSSLIHTIAFFVIKLYLF